MATQAKRNFKKLSNVEHVRLRTGMWLGQNSISLFDQHFFNLQSDGRYQIEHKEVEDVPAKLKCLDEACMNAVDEFNRNLKDRSIKNKDKMNTLSISLSDDQKRVTIIDNGRGIPAANAEQVFLHLMYGENFDDELKKEHVAGQNGVGISLVRIVSHFFRVKTHNKGKSFEKIFTLTDRIRETMEKLKLTPGQQEDIQKHFDEMGYLTGASNVPIPLVKQLNTVAKKEKMLGVIKEVPKTEHGTEIEFELNPTYFTNLDTSFDATLMEQYLQDLAMTNPGLTVVFTHQNNRKEFFFKKGLEDIFANSLTPTYKIAYSNPTTHLELVSFIVGEAGKSLSWVNSNFASLGGSSIEYLINLICDEVRKKPVIAAFEKRLKTTSTRNDVRNCFHMYNNFHLINPRFKSQDKSYLINDLKEDIRKLVQQNLDKLIKKLDLINRVKYEIQKRTQLRELDEAQKELKKTNRSVIPKFIPCTSKKKEVIKTLFIGEGDSAIAGLRQVRDPAVHGLFPLRGKPLNVREMPLSKTMQNEELKNIVSIIGLPFDRKLTSLDELDFDRVSIITDADYDGYAIRSLMFNFFFEYWPELYELGFIYLTEAPLFEVVLLNAKKEKKLFYCNDEQEYEALIKKSKNSNVTLLRKKRNKGLGETSSPALAYALDNGMKRISLQQMNVAKKVQNLWFHKNEAAQRRREISSYKQLFLED